MPAYTLDVQGDEGLEERVAAAWRDFIGAADLKYPASAWPAERLLGERWYQDQEADRRGERGTAAELDGRPAQATAHYRAAATADVEALVIGAVLAERGETTTQGAADEMANAMARVITGAGPERRMVTGRGPDGRKTDMVLLDEASDLGFQTLWERAAVHAARYRMLEGPSGAEPRHDRPAPGPDRGTDFDR